MHLLSSLLSKKIIWKNSPQNKDRWIDFFQWRGVLIWVEFPRPRKEMVSSVTLKINVIPLNSFFFQNRDRSTLVNRSKTGVIVNVRQENLTSMCDWRPFTISFLWKSSMHLQVPLAIFSRHAGSSQIMMNISEHGNFLTSLRFILWVIYKTSFFALFIHIMYICSLVYHTRE